MVLVLGCSTARIDNARRGLDKKYDECIVGSRPPATADNAFGPFCHICSKFIVRSTTTVTI